MSPAALLLALALPASAAEVTPAWRGMGPLTAALSSARKEWRRDACLAGLSYSWHPIQRFEPETKKQIPDALESYIYAFLSPSKPESLFMVRYDDRFDGIATIERGVREADLEPPSRQHSRCLTELGIDAWKALAAADKRGLTVWDRRKVEAAAVSLPVKPGDFDACEAPTGRGLHSARCKALTPNDKARLKSLRGNEFWIVSTKDGAAYLDASDGRFLFRVLVGE